VARLGDYIREECNPLGPLGARELRLIGVSNEHGLHSSSRDTSSDLSRYQRIEKNWFAYNPMRVNVGSIGLADDELKTGFTSPDYTVFSCREGLDPHYLLHFLKSDYGLEAIARNCTGAVRKRLYYSGLADIELPVPSMDGQRAFVARISHINEAIRFIRDENSDRHELPQLKQAILQEAIQGKLTADWRAAHPEVEPASQLLHRIQAEKARLIAAKKLRPEKPLPKITPAEIPFEIPKSWEWCRIGEVCKISSGKGFEKNEYSESGVRLFQIANVSIGETSWETTVHVPASYSVAYPDLQLNEGDLVMALNRPLLGRKLKVAILTEADVPAVLYQRVGRFDMIERTLIPWLFAYLTSDCFSGWLYDQIKGVNIPFVNQSKVHTHLFPLPPLAEQAAIVERVEALMTTCRALEAEIEHARTHAAHLLQAVLKEAFAPASS
jgi:type I restriction enzyme S subunit